MSSAVFKAHRIYRRSLGFSLIQALISFTLSLLIVAGVFSWHQVVKTILIKFKDKRAHLTVGSTALQLIMNDLKYSGYRGCRSLDENYPVRLHMVSHVIPYQFYALQSAVMGFVANSACKKQLPEATCDRLKPGTHVLVIYNIPRTVTSLKRSLENPSDDIFVAAAESMQKHHSLILVNDCYTADIFVAEDVDKGEGKIFRKISPQSNASRELSKAYQAGSEVVELSLVAYYVGHENTLFRDDLSHEAQKVLQGVRALEMEYALPIGGEGIHYRHSQALTASDWPLVVGVRLKLTTTDEKVWEYEFSIRNRRHPYLRFNPLNDDL